MRSDLPILRGRGAASDPTNRFESLAVELDPDEASAEPGRRQTRYLRDPSRKVLTTNQSPDVGFEWSLNPYRGCEHGCVYCLAPETPVLHSDLIWRPLGEVKVGDRLLGFDELPDPGGSRKLRTSIVEAVWWSRRPTVRLIGKRTEVVTTSEHRWLLQGGRWVPTVRLRRGWSLRHLAVPCDLPGEGEDHRAVRTREGLLTGRPPTEAEPLLALERGPRGDVVDIQTSTRTFYAAGLATHNCYARPTHEYLGFSPGLDFESRILVKEEAPALLRKGLSAPGWKPTTLVMSGVTDPYQPVERKLGITRRCLEVLEECGHPVAVITKSRLVTRDVDLLGSLAARDAAHATISITTLDRRLQRTLEPRASPPEHRLEAIRLLSEAGVPVAVNVAPIIPGLTEHEIPAILEAAADAGAISAGRVMLRLPWAVKELFEEWLRSHVPDRADKVLNRIREARGGKLYDAAFGQRMKGSGVFARQIDGIFKVSARKAGLERRMLTLSAEHFRRPRAMEEGPQLRLEL
jgi:DNA repair photolyase